MLLLDSNVWRYLTDEETIADLSREASRRQLKILVAPSVVYEALRTPDEGLRSTLVSSMLWPQWRRLMPEAYEEVEEFVRAANRFHPDWIRAEPPNSLRQRVEHDWRRRQRGFWDRVRRAPDQEAERLRALEGDTLDVARAQAQSARREYLEAGWTFEGTELSEMKAVPFRSLPGVGRGAVDPWRASGMMWAQNSFTRPPMSEWIGERFRIDDVARTEWLQFWLYEVQPVDLPRWWLRSSCEILFATRKVSPGTPCDTQLATYLVDAHLFFTFDKILHDVLERVRSQDVFPMARSVLLRREQLAGGGLQRVLRDL